MTTTSDPDGALRSLCDRLRTTRPHLDPDLAREAFVAQRAARRAGDKATEDAIVEAACEAPTRNWGPFSPRRP